MPEETVKRVASFADSWWKILTIIGAVILLIYEVSGMLITVKDIEVRQELYEQHVEKEFNIRDERSDKRYQRASEMYEELKKEGLKLEQELEEFKIKQSYENGRNDMYRELNKNK